MSKMTSYYELGSTNESCVSIQSDFDPALVGSLDRETYELEGYSRELEEVPQGRHLGIFSTMILFVSRIVGSGIFATSSGIYKDVNGSPIQFFLVWITAATLAFCGLYVFLELGCLIPRSGGMKTFLEVIYNKPYMLTCVVVSIYSVVTGFVISSTIIFGEYFLRSIGVDPSYLNVRITGWSFVALATIVHGINVHLGIRIQNFLGGLKLLLLGFMIFTGFYSVFFPESVTHVKPQLDFHDFFVFKEFNFSKFASAVIKASFSFAGWNTVHNVSSEIKDPIRTLKVAGPCSLIIVTIAYFSINMAYLYVLSPDDIIDSKNLVGSLLFEKLFGVILGRTILTFSVSLCAAGNILVVIYSLSRVSYEVFREGILPFSKFMVKPTYFNTPVQTLLLCLIFTSLVLCTPDGDIYNYIIDIEGYPVQVFTAFCALGIFILRRRHPSLVSPIKSSILGTTMILVITSYLIISPLISRDSPNPPGLENWPAYPLVTYICLAIGFLYWLIMFRALPYYFGYKLVNKSVKLENGVMVRVWSKVKSGI